MANPTESASILVATPWIISVANVRAATPSFFSSPSFLDSIIILIPIYAKSMSAIYGIAFWKRENLSAIVLTQNHPTKGISVWKTAKVRAIDIFLPLFILGVAIASATDTLNASNASPKPRRILLRNKSLQSIFHSINMIIADWPRVSPMPDRHESRNYGSPGLLQYVDGPAFGAPTPSREK